MRRMMLSNSNRFSDRFHRAARDGNLLILKEATKRDLNRCDDDGMTPVHWASHDGKLEALRLMTGRGGNPDLPDSFGNTALHHAVRQDQFPCVTFLINFGCDIWAVDDDGHSAFDIAGAAGYDAMLRYLDAESASRLAKNPKVVEKQRSKAVQEAQRRLWKKERDLERRLADLELRSESRSNDQSFGITASVIDTRGVLAGVGGASRLAADATPPTPNPVGKTRQNVIKTVRQRVIASLNLKNKKSDANRKQKGATVPFSGNAVSAVNRRRCLSLSALTQSTSQEVVYSNPIVPPINPDQKSPSSSSKPLGLFERPGFGSVSFRNLQVVAMFTSIQTPGDLCTFNYGTIDEDAELLDVDFSHSESDDSGKLLHNFLQSLGIEEYFMLFERERITIDNLKLLSDQDLTELGIPMGPRKLILEAISRPTV